MTRTPLRIAAGAAAAGLALSGTPHAWAADSHVIVDGDNFEARGLSVISQDCVDTGVEPAQRPEFRVVRGPLNPPHGSHSIGWAAAQVEGIGIGPAAHVASPTELASVVATVYSPNSYAAWVGVATFVEPNRSGIWKGVTTLNQDDGTGWHDIEVNAYDDTFTWRHYDASGALDETEADKLTLANLVNDRGGNHRGAEVGVMVGCDGDSVFLDSLAVRTENQNSGGTRTYDFEGFQTKTTLTASKKSVAKGGKVTLRTKLNLVTGKDAVNGTVVVEQKKKGSSKFTKIATRSTGSDGVVALLVKPSKTTTYRASYAGEDRIDSSSDTITIKVKKR